MSVIRGPIPADNFTIIDNGWLRDAALSWKAKGLLAYIASHHAGHRLTRDQILAQATDGKDSVQAGLRELEESGYLSRVRIRGEGGRIEGTVYRLGSPVDGAVEEAGAGSSSNGKPGPGREQGEVGTSAGGASAGFSTSGEPAGKKTSSQKTKEKTTSSASPRRGTRLPEDFSVSDEMRDWYRLNVGNSINGLTEHEKFLDYWRAQPGSKGVKLDWAATWRNWMRTAMERQGARPTSGAPAGAGSKPRYPTAAERSHERLMSERDLLLEAEAIVEQMGGDPEKDHAKVTEVYNRLVSTGRIGSATRKPGMYSDIDGEVVGPKEVTAGEGQ